MGQASPYHLAERPPGNLPGYDCQPAWRALRQLRRGQGHHQRRSNRQHRYLDHLHFRQRVQPTETWLRQRPRHRAFPHGGGDGTPVVAAEGAQRCSPMTVVHPFRRLLRVSLILFIGALVGVPFYWLVISALKTSVEVAAYPPTWFPSEFRWQNIPD